MFDRKDQTESDSNVRWEGEYKREGKSPLKSNTHGRAEREIGRGRDGAALTLFTLLEELRQMQMLATVPFMNAAADVREGNRFNI